VDKDKEKLTEKQRLLLLEEQVELLMEYTENIRVTQSKIMKGLTTLIDQQSHNKKEMEKWSESVEGRLGKLMVQQVNMGIVMDTLFPMSEMTEEQLKMIQEKAEEIKKKVDEEKREELV